MWSRPLTRSETRVDAYRSIVLVFCAFVTRSLPAAVGQLCEQLAKYRGTWPSKLENGQVPWNLTTRSTSHRSVDGQATWSWGPFTCPLISRWSWPVTVSLWTAKMVLIFTGRNDPKVSPGRARGKSPLAAGNSVQRARRLLSRLRRLETACYWAMSKISGMWSLCANQSSDTPTRRSAGMPSLRNA
jgi:hypothetical protein